MSVDFIDSNVLLYLFDSDNEIKQSRAQEVFDLAHETKSGVISFQVVQETLNVLSRKRSNPFSPDDAARVLEEILCPLWLIMPSPLLYRKALEVRSKYKYSFYDSMILASAILYGCKRVLSEDLQHGQRIEGIRIENPFAL